MGVDLSPYKNISVSPLTGFLGAEIGRVDANNHLAAPVSSELRQALAEFHVIFLRDQSLDDTAILRLATVFGTPSVAPLADCGVEQRYIGRLAREADVPAPDRNLGD